MNTGSAGATFIYPSGVVQPGDFGIGITIDTDLYSNSGSPAKESGAVITRGGNSQQQGTRIQPPVNIGQLKAHVLLLLLLDELELLLYYSIRWFCLYHIFYFVRATAIY